MDNACYLLTFGFLWACAGQASSHWYRGSLLDLLATIASAFAAGCCLTIGIHVTLKRKDCGKS